MAEKRFLPLPPFLRFLFDVPSVANAEITSQETLMALEKDKNKKKVSGNKDQEPETPSKPPEDPREPLTGLPYDILGELFDLAKEVDKTLPKEDKKTTEIEVEVKEEEGKTPEIKYTVGEQGSFMEELERSFELNKKVKDAEAMLEYFESRGMDQEAKKLRREINEFKKKNNI